MKLFSICLLHRRKIKMKKKEKSKPDEKLDYLKYFFFYITSVEHISNSTFK